MTEFKAFYNQIGISKTIIVFFKLFYIFKFLKNLMKQVWLFCFSLEAATFPIDVLVEVRQADSATT